MVTRDFRDRQGRQATEIRFLLRPSCLVEVPWSVSPGKGVDEMGLGWSVIASVYKTLKARPIALFVFGVSRLYSPLGDSRAPAYVGYRGATRDTSLAPAFLVI